MFRSTSMITIFAFIASVEVCTPGLYAQQEVNNQLQLTVDQAVKLGIENSRALHASSMKVEAADAKETETRSGRLPSLKFNGAYTRLSDVPATTVVVPLPAPLGTQSFVLSPTVLTNYNARLTLQQPLFTGFKLENATSAAEYSTRAAEQDYAKDKSDLSYNIKVAYWNLFKAGEIKKVVDENVDQVKAHLADVQHLMDQGMATNNDVLRVQVQLSNAQLIQIDANNNVRLAIIALDNVMGIPLSTFVGIASKPREVEDTSNIVNPNLGGVDSYVQRAQNQRHEILAMDYRVKAGEAGVSAARGGWWPQIFLAGNYYYSRPNSRIFPTVDEFKDTWDVGIVASWDIWNWGATASQTTQAQSQLIQAQDARQQVKDGVTLEVTQNYLGVKQAAEKIGVSNTAVQQALENYRVTDEKFKSGLALNTDLLDAEVALLQAKTNYTQTLVDYELAQARLAKSIGEEQD